MAADAEPLLEVRDLSKHFPLYQPWLLGFARRQVGTIRAVEGVSFAVRRGETLGLVGESGCGKTTTARLVLRALTPTRGEILFRRAGELVRVERLHGQALRALRPHIQMIFQDPFSSLNPRMPVGEIIGEPLRIHRYGSRDEIMERVKTLMGLVGLNAQYVRRYPHAFSGGQRQRIGIARALALNPDLIVCDEPVSALDVSVQAQVLNLLKDLQAELGLTYLFISHNLAVVDYIADEIAVMYGGRIVEQGPKARMFEHPRHPYTLALLAAVLRPEARARESARALVANGDGGAAPPATGGGCAYAPRCPFVVDACHRRAPEPVPVGPDHWARCLRVDEIPLTAPPPRPAGRGAGGG